MHLFSFLSILSLPLQSCSHFIVLHSLFVPHFSVMALLIPFHNLCSITIPLFHLLYSLFTLSLFLELALLFAATRVSSFWQPSASRLPRQTWGQKSWRKNRFSSLPFLLSIFTFVFPKFPSLHCALPTCTHWHFTHAHRLWLPVHLNLFFSV